MNALAYKLGLSTELQFYDVWSLTEPEQLELIPRPVLALLGTITYRGALFLPILFTHYLIIFYFLKSLPVPEKKLLTPQ
jgi:hypothetical protein